MAWQRAASLSAIGEGTVVGAELGTTPIALFNLGGTVYATHGICTHAMALLSEGWVEDGKIECPLHQGQFDIRTGKALCAPLTEDLRTYAVKVEGDDIFVDIDAPCIHPQNAVGARRHDKTGETSASTLTVVIAGAGQAAAAAIRAMRESGFNGAIDLIGDEPHLPYERPPLSKKLLLGGDATTSTRLSEADAHALGVRLHLGRTVSRVDAAQKRVTLDDGEQLPYDSLLIAAGGRARRLAVPGSDLPGVLHLRTLEDATAIDRALAGAHHVAVIGGGFIGLELASAAIARGVAVTVLEREAEIMARLLPASLGRAFRRLAERHGVEVRRNAEAREITRRGGRFGVVTDSDTLEVDAVLVGIGLEPALELAISAGCRVAGGIEVDAEGRTSVAGIWAAGDCALHPVPVVGRRVRLESWHNAEEQGAAAGRSIAGAADEGRLKKPWFWTDQFGLNIQMVGTIGTTDIVARVGDIEASEGAVYRTIDRDSGRLTGVVAFSAPNAIRQARRELEATIPFNLDAANVFVLAEDTPTDTVSEEAAMNANPSLALTKRYLWPAEGLSRIPDWVYTDQTIYEREIEKIFHGRTWNYVALECEIPNPGDFIRSNVGPTPVVVARAEDGSINVFENRCAHRAAEFCRELSGNAKEFVCPYHQWSYDLKGNLAGVPFRRGVNGKGGMPADFKNTDHGLRQLNVTAHRGVVFASYCNDMESFQDYLGAEVLREFEATFDGRRPKLLGYYRHTLPGNWKLYHENLKDPYHATLLHTFLVTFGLLVAGNRSLMLADPTGRHGVMASAKSDGAKVASDTKKEMRAYREGMTLSEPRFMNCVDEFDSPWSVTMATIWPNLIIQREMNTLGVRHIVPTGPHEFIMKWTMFGFEGDDEEMTRHRLRQGNLMGPAGFLGLEDNEAIKFVQDGMQHVPNGEHLVELDPEVETGTAESLISEAAIRAMYKHWRQVMGL